jgi:hypothetical protein
MKMLDQFACSRLIAAVHAFEAACQVERLIRHMVMETASYTSGKTWLGGSRLQLISRNNPFFQARLVCAEALDTP